MLCLSAVLMFEVFRVRERGRPTEVFLICCIAVWSRAQWFGPKRATASRSKRHRRGQSGIVEVKAASSSCSIRVNPARAAKTLLGAGARLRAFEQGLARRIACFRFSCGMTRAYSMCATASTRSAPLLMRSAPTNPAQAVLTLLVPPKRCSAPEQG